ncbi:hypothetical protein CVIRNUC_009442 [Coccomyxa viridis]|uniref:Transmembrane protein n=1 Tax=Coccomyxa viridis TaxID=1274662 RepID=A0AAV1IJV5_9CHLO|nr:hypothetical protein CVIRNUC_009442 [Coccomyxa viridis]
MQHAHSAAPQHKSDSAAGVSEQQAQDPMSSSARSNIAQPLLTSEIQTGASSSTTGEDADVLRSFAEAGTPHPADAMRQMSLQGELRAVSLRIDAITGLPLNVYAEPISEPPTGRFQPPGTFLQLPDVDEAESKWEDGQPLYAVWMASSAICFLSSLFWLQLGFLTGILGMIGASLMLCRCHRSFNMKLAVVVTAAQALACICMAVSASVALVFLYFLAVMRCNRDIHSRRYCFQLNFTLAMLVLWYVCHAVGSAIVASHASSVKKMLDPVRSGVLLVPHPGSRVHHDDQHSA